MPSQVRLERGSPSMRSCGRSISGPTSTSCFLGPPGCFLGPGLSGYRYSSGETYALTLILHWANEVSKCHHIGKIRLSSELHQHVGVSTPIFENKAPMFSNFRVVPERQQNTPSNSEFASHQIPQNVNRVCRVRMLGSYLVLWHFA